METFSSSASNIVINTNENYGLVVYGIVCFVLVVFFTLYLTYQFVRPGIPIVVILLTFLSWCASFCVCFLVPIDLIPGAEDSLDTVWSILFWLSFLLMWFVIPFMIEYYDNGGFTFKQKSIASIRSNALFYAICAIIGGLGLIYLLTAAHMTMESVSGLFICISNVWGLIILVFLSGYGLAGYPSYLWNKANLKHRLDLIYCTTTKIFHEAEDARDELIAIFEIVKQCENKFETSENEIYLRYFQQIKQEMCEKEVELSNIKHSNHPVDILPLRSYFTNESELDLVALQKLHHAVKKTIRHLSLVESQWYDIVNESIQLKQKIKTIENNTYCNGKMKFFNRLRWNSHVIFVTNMHKALSIGAWILSVLIVLCEMTILSTTDVSPLGMLINSDVVKKNPINFQIFTVIPLVYIFLCTCWPLFNIRLFRLYYVGHRGTDENSILLNAKILLRLSNPLAYNFVLLLKGDASSLINFVGKVQVIPFFGSSFNTLFPVFIGVIFLLTSMNFFNRFLSCLGVEPFQPTIINQENLDTIEEGRRLIEYEIRKRENQMNEI